MAPLIQLLRGLHSSRAISVLGLFLALTLGAPSTAAAAAGRAQQPSAAVLKLRLDLAEGFAANHRQEALQRARGERLKPGLKAWTSALKYKVRAWRVARDARHLDKARVLVETLDAPQREASKAATIDKVVELIRRSGY